MQAIKKIGNKSIYWQVYNSPNTPVLENPEYQTRWYFKYFLGKCKMNDFVYKYFISIKLKKKNVQNHH